MLFEEYKQIILQILAISEKIEKLCQKGKSDETDELFHTRNELLQKLSIPEDLNDENFAEIVAIKDQITKKNADILKAMQKEQESLKKDAEQLKQKANMQNFIPEDRTLNDLKNSYKNPPSFGDGGSIFGK